MSTKGEKQGFSGAIEHWMACKVLKRKGYYLDSHAEISFIYAAAPACSCISDRSQQYRTRLRYPAASAVSRAPRVLRTPFHSWPCGHRGVEFHLSAADPGFTSSPVHTRTADSRQGHVFQSSSIVWYFSSTSSRDMTPSSCRKSARCTTGTSGT